VLPEDSAQFASQKFRFPISRPDLPLCPKHLSGCPFVQSIIRPDDENFLSGPSPVSKSFKLLKLVSVQTFQQHIRTTLSARQASGFLSKTQLWEDRCNRPDALIHKASIVFKSQTSERQSAWSRPACIRYGNCMHQINRPDDHPPGPDVRSPYMEITCSGSAAVRMRLKNRKEF